MKKNGQTSEAWWQDLVHAAVSDFSRGWEKTDEAHEGRHFFVEALAVWMINVRIGLDT